MMDRGGLRYQFARLDVAGKLIAVNVLIFLINGLLYTLLNLSPDFISRWFELPKNFMAFIFQPWSLVTYSFFHAGLWHLFWNMVMLYFSARIFLNLFSAKRFLNVYFLGVIVGGLVFLISYNIFPALLASNTALIGASAGVTAVLIFICAYIPNQEVRVFFFNLKLWYVGAFFVLVDLLQIPGGSNIGGHLAHLGGAFLGYVYARQLFKGKDIGQGFERMMDTVAGWFKPRKKAPFKTVYKNKTTSTQNTRKSNYEKESKQRKIDAILDKISKSGYDSLSKEEKDFLFKAGKEN